MRFNCCGRVRSDRSENGAKSELHPIVQLSDTTIYEQEQRSEFPQRFNFAPQCVLWDLAEIHTSEARRSASMAGKIKQAPYADVRLRQRGRVRAEVSVTKRMKEPYRGR